MASHLNAAIATIAFKVAGCLVCSTFFAVTLTTGTPDQRTETKFGTRLLLLLLFRWFAILILLLGFWLRGWSQNGWSIEISQIITSWLLAVSSCEGRRDKRSEKLFLNFLNVELLDDDVVVVVDSLTSVCTSVMLATLIVSANSDPLTDISPKCDQGRLSGP